MRRAGCIHFYYVIIPQFSDLMRLRHCTSSFSVPQSFDRGTRCAPGSVKCSYNIDLRWSSNKEFIFNIVLLFDAISRNNNNIIIKLGCNVVAIRKLHVTVWYFTVCNGGKVYIRDDLWKWTPQKPHREPKADSSGEVTPSKRQKKTPDANPSQDTGTRRSGVTASEEKQSQKEPSQMATILNMLVNIKENQDKLGARVGQQEVDCKYYDEPVEVREQQWDYQTQPQIRMHVNNERW